MARTKVIRTSPLRVEEIVADALNEASSSGSEHASEGQAAALFVAEKLLDISGTQLRALKIAEAAVGAIACLQRRRCFCEATFRAAFFSRELGLELLEGSLGRNEPIVMAVFCQAGLCRAVLDCPRHLIEVMVRELFAAASSVSDPGQRLSFLRPLGTLLGDLVEAAGEADGGADAGVAGASGRGRQTGARKAAALLASVRDKWRESGGERLALAVDATRGALTPATFSSLWAHEVAFSLTEAAHNGEAEDEEEEMAAGGRPTNMDLDENVNGTLGKGNGQKNSEKALFRHLCDHAVPRLVPNDVLAVLEEVLLSSEDVSGARMGRVSAFLERWQACRPEEDFQAVKAFFLEVGGGRALFANERLWAKLVLCISRTSDPGVRADWLRDHLGRQASANHGQNAPRFTSRVLKGEPAAIHQHPQTFRRIAPFSPPARLQ